MDAEHGELIDRLVAGVLILKNGGSTTISWDPCVFDIIEEHAELMSQAIDAELNDRQLRLDDLGERERTEAVRRLLEICRLDAGPGRMKRYMEGAVQRNAPDPDAPLDQVDDVFEAHYDALESVISQIELTAGPNQLSIKVAAEAIDAVDRQPKLCSGDFQALLERRRLSTTHPLGRLQLDIAGWLLGECRAAAPQTVKDYVTTKPRTDAPPKAPELEGDEADPIAMFIYAGLDVAHRIDKGRAPAVFSAIATSIGHLIALSNAHETDPRLIEYGVSFLENCISSKIFSDYPVEQARAQLYLADLLDLAEPSTPEAVIRTVELRQRALDGLNPRGDTANWVSAAMTLSNQCFALAGTGSWLWLDKAITYNEMALEVMGSQFQLQDRWSVTTSLERLYCFRSMPPQGADSEKLLAAVRRVYEDAEQDADEQLVGDIEPHLALAYMAYGSSEGPDRSDVAIVGLTSLAEKANPLRTKGQNAHLRMQIGQCLVARTRATSADDIALAIEQYKQAIESLSPIDDPETWSHGSSQLGACYLFEPLNSDVGNLELAEKCFVAALSVLGEQSNSPTWLTAKEGLGNAYRLRGFIEPEYMDRAIQQFDEVLARDPRSFIPGGFALTNGQLATCLTARADASKGDPERAIKHYEIALSAWSPGWDTEAWTETIRHILDVLIMVDAEKREEVFQRVERYCIEALAVIDAHAAPGAEAAVRVELARAYGEWPDSTGENVERAMRILEELVGRGAHAQSSVDLADRLNQLAVLYRKRRASPSDNARAIELYKLALEHLGDQNPGLIGRVRNNLGNSISESDGGEPGRNLEEALRHFSVALQVRTIDRDKYGFAETHFNIANAYLRGSDLPAKSADAALGHLQMALTALQPSHSLYAPVHVRMARAHLVKTDDCQPDRTTAIALLREAIAILEQRGAPEELALARLTLAGAIVDADDRSPEAGEIDLTIEEAIEQCDLVLRLPPLGRFSAYVAEAHSIRATAFLSRTRGKYSDNLIEAAGSVEAVTARASAVDGSPASLFAIALMRATAYREKADGNFSENIEAAINALQPLRSQTARELDELLWAEGQLILGDLYKDRSVGVLADNMEAAIDACSNAADFYASHKDVVKWASAITNLGNAYAERIIGDPAENIERCIDCILQGLRARSRSVHEILWARALVSLGRAYNLRLLGERAENIELGIKYSRLGLGVLIRESSKKSCLKIYINLGVLYADRIEGGDESNIDRAISYYKDALKLCGPDDDAFLWANIHANMAGLLVKKHEDEDPSSFLHDAKIHCERALEIYKEEEFPRRHCSVMINLAAVCASLSSVAGEEYLSLAQEYYAHALTDVLAEVEPVVYIGASVDYARVLRRLGRLDEARDVLTRALDRREALLWGAPSRSATRDLVDRTAALGHDLAELFVRRGDPGAAVGVLERCRAVSLRQAFALDAAALSDVPHDLRRRIEEARDTLATLARQLESDDPSRSDSLDTSAIVEQLAATRSRLRNALDTAGLSPSSPLLDADSRRIATQNGPVVWIAAGKDISYAIVAKPNSEDIGTADVVTLELLSRGKVRELLHTWLSSYYPTLGKMLRASDDAEFNRLFRQLDTTLEDILAELGHVMMAPIVDHLLEQGFTDADELVLLPQGDLGLFPLHAAPLRGGARVVDHYPVSYAPSLYSLQTSRRRLRALSDEGRIDGRKVGRDLYGVFNPMAGTSDALPRSESEELPALRDVFESVGQSVRPLRGAQAKLSEVVNGLAAEGYVHFACHGRFDFMSPDQSGLQLANNERLTASVIATTRLDGCRLVTLSACETGMTGVIRLADEFIGLPAAFLQAGAVGVVGTLWSVLDEPSAQVAKDFYAAHLVDGLSPPRALRHAIQNLRAKGTDDLTNLTLVWAAYAHHGA